MPRIAICAVALAACQEQHSQHHSYAQQKRPHALPGHKVNSRTTGTGKKDKSALAMTLVEDFLSCRFPSELIVHIIQCIDGWDLVAMCKANPEWEALVEAEGLWHKAAQYRWPHIAGGEQPLILGESGSDEVLTTGPGAQPIAMSAWMHALAGSSRWSLPNDHDNARANLPPPPPAGSG
ncbi:hypothetical protein T492DRAFT_915252 [Pavlovales sp. CCMP2436]|nr:hypothetical protein T492DRAFT_915252 [Pavlovales sp. CCMP2436]